MFVPFWLSTWESSWGSFPVLCVELLLLPLALNHRRLGRRTEARELHRELERYLGSFSDTKQAPIFPESSPGVPRVLLYVNQKHGALFGVVSRELKGNHSSPWHPYPVLGSSADGLVLGFSGKTKPASLSLPVGSVGFPFVRMVVSRGYLVTGTLYFRFVHYSYQTLHVYY